MTVKELIEELKGYPEDMLICTNDYEQGVDEVGQIRIEKNFAVWRGGNMTRQDVLVIE